MSGNWGKLNELRRLEKIGRAAASIDGWVDVACKVECDAQETGARLYSSYCKWAASKHEEPMAQRVFLLKLSEHRVPRMIIGGVRVWLGLALVDEWVGAQAVVCGPLAQIFEEWIKERCFADPQATTLSCDMYSDFLEWGASKGYKKITKVALGGFMRSIDGLRFGKSLLQMEVNTPHVQRSHYVGIRLKETPYRIKKFEEDLRTMTTKKDYRSSVSVNPVAHIPPAYDDSDDI
jgi:hypothetical protein